MLCLFFLHSQFTLYATFKGNKPDYHNAMAGELSETFYNTFLEKLRAAHNKPELIKGAELLANKKYKT